MISSTAGRPEAESTTPPISAYEPPRHEHGHSAGTESRELSFTGVAISILNHRRLLGLPPLLAIIVAVLTLVWPKSYTTTISFVPNDNSADLSKLAGVAASFGFALPTSDGTTTPDFYADLVTTPVFLQRIATARYALDNAQPHTSATFVELSKAGGSSPEDSIYKAMKQLNDQVLTVETNTTTGLVRIHITTAYPQVSEQMGRGIIRLVNGFDVNVRQARARAEEAFMRSTTQTALDSLRLAETALEVFLERNRQFASDPQLQLAHDRLQRDIDMRQAVYTSLAQSLEQARIDAVRNTPSVSIVEAPQFPLVPDESHLVKKTVLGFLAGIILLAIGVAVIDDPRRHPPTEDNKARVRAALRELTGRLRRIAIRRQRMA